MGKYYFHVPRQVLAANDEEFRLYFRGAELRKVFYHKRDKIKADPTVEILTIKGIGYRFLWGRRILPNQSVRGKTGKSL